MSDVFIPGVLSIIVFYSLVLIVGIWAARKFPGESELDTMNAGRRLGTIVGTLTLIATWAGGGYISGSAEQMYSKGLINCEVPIGYSIALLVGAHFFIKRMRDGGYITLLDPFQYKYGYKYGAFLILPALCSEVFWCASVLNSLGTALTVILGISPFLSVLVSSIFGAVYTLIGGLISVSFTDVLELVFIMCGLLLSVPFAFCNPYVNKILTKDEMWGKIEKNDVAMYCEDMIVLVLGGIPWQGYFQRVFSIRTTRIAIKMSWLSAFGCFFVAVPALSIGVIAKMTDWKQVDGFNRDVNPDESSLILPLVLRYLTPTWVSFFGLGAVTGAVMASANSSILAASALISRNLYKHLFRPKALHSMLHTMYVLIASDREIHWTFRISIICVSVFAAAIALTVESIYYLSFMCSDFVYVVLFPQLVLLLYCEKYVNVYGSMVSYIFGILFRALAGEVELGLPVVLKYPLFNEKTQKQGFPFRTFIMIGSLIILISLSVITQKLHDRGWFSPKIDFMGAFKEKKPVEETDINQEKPVPTN